MHGAVPTLWRPDQVSYDEFAEHLRFADDFPTYLPWPMSPGWAVTDFGVVTDARDRARASVTCCSGTSELDGPVDVFFVAEEAGVGLGARVASLVGDDPGHEIGDGPPTVRVRIASQQVSLWSVSTAGSDSEFDRSVFAGEAAGRWLWIVLPPGLGDAAAARRLDPPRRLRRRPAAARDALRRPAPRLVTRR